jgi:hypothetical protein
MTDRSGEEDAYHWGTASMSTAAELDDAFTPAPPHTPRTVTAVQRRSRARAPRSLRVVEQAEPDTAQISKAWGQHRGATALVSTGGIENCLPAGTPGL